MLVHTRSNDSIFVGSLVCSLMIMSRSRFLTNAPSAYDYGFSFVVAGERRTKINGTWFKVRTIEVDSKFASVQVERYRKGCYLVVSV